MISLLKIVTKEGAVYYFRDPLILKITSRNSLIIDYAESDYTRVFAADEIADYAIAEGELPKGKFAVIYAELIDWLERARGGSK